LADKHRALCDLTVSIYADEITGKNEKFARDRLANRFLPDRIQRLMNPAETGEKILSKYALKYFTE